MRQRRFYLFWKFSANVISEVKFYSKYNLSKKSPQNHAVVSLLLTLSRNNIIQYRNNTEVILWINSRHLKSQYSLTDTCKFNHLKMNIILNACFFRMSSTPFAPLRNWQKLFPTSHQWRPPGNKWRLNYAARLGNSTPVENKLQIAHKKKTLLARKK